ncbi:MAG: nicotinate (nicotinamide) nucleotide adenylyltransferase [Anaerolineae bacterium]|nr:nicotinate (nicotinamide) nucleotide adenylyltransferase [Anaerolineae bacterium]
MARIGVFGGTFDPPHIGHLILAEVARDSLDLEAVLWVVAADPPHKQGLSITPVSHRLQMVELVAADNAAFRVSTVDVERPGPHYSVDMLRLLSGQYPDDELVFIIGGDSLADLPQWHQPRELIEMTKLAVLNRPTASFDWPALESAIPGLREHVVMLHGPQIAVAGVDLRRRFHKGQSVRYLIPEPIISYIRANNLYHEA